MKEWFVLVPYDQLDAYTYLVKDNPPSQMYGYQGGDTQTETQDPNPPQNGSSTTLTDPVVGEKRKHTEIEYPEVGCKKRKDDKTTCIVGLDGDNFTLLTNFMV